MSLIDNFPSQALAGSMRQRNGLPLSSGPLSRAASMAPRIALGMDGMLDGAIPTEQRIGFANGGLIGEDDPVDQAGQQAMQNAYLARREGEKLGLESFGYDPQELGYANGGLIGEDPYTVSPGMDVPNDVPDLSAIERRRASEDAPPETNALNTSTVRSIMSDSEGIGGGITRGLMSESAFNQGGGRRVLRGFANGGLLDNPIDPRQRAVPRLSGPGPSVPALQAPLYTPESIPRIAGPSANLPAQQVPWYTPETPARLGGPQPPAQPTIPAARLAGGGAALLAGGAAATQTATGTVAANPEYFKTSIGDDGLAANILMAAGQGRDEPALQSVPRIAQLSAGTSTAGAGRGYVNPPNMLAAGAGRGVPNPSQSAAAPLFDDTYRAENLRNMTNQAYREGDPIGDIIRQKTAQDITQPVDGGAGYFLQVGAQPSGQSAQKPIAFATFGGGTESSKAFYQDGTTADLRAGQPLPQDVQDFNRLSAQVGREAQQPVSVIRGLTTSVAMPNATAGDSSGFMREASQAAFDARKVPEFFAAQAQNSINTADPLAAKTASEVTVKNVENKGKTDAAKITADAHVEAAKVQGQAGKVPPGYRMTADGLSMEKVPGGPADLGKALPSPAVKELSGAGEAVEATRRMVNSFKPEFGGKTITGGLSNTVGRIMGDDTGQVQWWQDMEMRQNLARNALFGASQTKGELEAWEKTSVNPRMDPAEITKNLQLRAEIEARAASKLARGYAAAGYNKEQIGELLGTGAEFLEKPAPAVEKQAGAGQKAAVPTAPAPGRPAPSDQARVEDIAGKTAAVGKAAAKTGDPANYSPKTGTVEGGYRFKGGNPADPRAWEKA